MKLRMAPLVGLTVGLALFAGMARAAEEEAKKSAPKVLNVIAVKVKGDLDAYLARVKKLRDAADRAQSGGKFRVWRAAIAGPETGTVYIAVEYDDMEAYASGTSATRDDKDWAKLMKDLDASGMREVLGSSLLVELTP